MPSPRQSEPIYGTRANEQNPFNIPLRSMPGFHQAINTLFKDYDTSWLRPKDRGLLFNPWAELNPGQVTDKRRPKLAQQIRERRRKELQGQFMHEMLNNILLPPMVSAAMRAGNWLPWIDWMNSHHAPKTR